MVKLNYHSKLSTKWWRPKMWTFSFNQGDVDGNKKPRSSSKERRSGPHHRGSRESLTDSVQYDEEQPGIKTKIFHALGLNS